MRRALTLVCSALVILAACSSREEPAAPPAPAASESPVPPSFIPSRAQRDRFLAEGKEPTLRELARTDYWLHYKMMQATGIEQELGGEEQTIAALRSIGEAYERKLREAEVDMPKMIPAAFTGEGMGAGFTGMTMGTFVGMITGGMTSSMVSGMSDQRIAELNEAGPMKHGGPGGSWEMTVAKDGSLTHNVEFDAREKGLEGKVRIRSTMTACPDVNGKVTVDIEVESMMRMTGKAGVGGYVHNKFTYERYLDDDAHLIDTADGGASNLDIKIAGHENNETQSAHVRTGHARGGAPYQESLEERGFNIFRLDEARRTQELIKGAELMMTLMAEMMLRGIGSENGSPWESGRCIDLKATSNPAKRKGLKPSTSFELEAKPRVKADGSPAGGTVTATLTGGSKLDPAGTKVKADARFQYVGPDKKDETASVAFEARSKRGVGKATLEFDTKPDQAYTVEGGADEFHGTGVACNLGSEFVVRGSGVTVTFTPSGEHGGTYSYTGSMSGFAVWGNGTYTVNHHESGAIISATGPGSVKTPLGTHTRNGTETYTLTPYEGDCEG